MNNQPPSRSDDDIVRSLVHDLDTGFVLLFDKYRRIVFSTALRIGSGRADAEDVTAEAFLRAYRALAGYRPDQILALKLRTWLLTITLNACRNQQRDAGRQPACEPWDEVDEQVDRPDERVDVEQAIADSETSRELAASLAALPDHQHVAVVLRHVVDLPIAEIATVVGRSPGTVKSDISRALARLRRLHTNPLPRRGSPARRAPRRRRPADPVAGPRVPTEGPPNLRQPPIRRASVETRR
ncbi:MAG TPA: RNA polymerase sigma factor [Pseudonocardiaceae bacterium]|nr:RNA polymerase sigma factor [Pseudonocardiaceae bacterium]